MLEQHTAFFMVFNLWMCKELTKKNLVLIYFKMETVPWSRFQKVSTLYSQQQVQHRVELESEIRMFLECIKPYIGKSAQKVFVLWNLPEAAQAESMSAAADPLMKELPCQILADQCGYGL